jgi:hypothetical protein
MTDEVFLTDSAGDGVLIVEVETTTATGDLSAADLDGLYDELWARTLMMLGG